MHAWALAADFDVTRIGDSRFTTEWPPRSGQMQQFPEIDRAEWFDLDEARLRILPAQAALLERLEEKTSAPHE